MVGELPIWNFTGKVMVGLSNHIFIGTILVSQKTRRKGTSSTILMVGLLWVALHVVAKYDGSLHSCAMLKILKIQP